MKDRILKFYEDHKTGIVVGSASVAVAALVTMRKAREPKVSAVELWQSTDGTYAVRVAMKNGRSSFFDIKPK